MPGVRGVVGVRGVAGEVELGGPKLEAESAPSNDGRLSWPFPFDDDTGGGEGCSGGKPSDETTRLKEGDWLLLLVA